MFKCRKVATEHPTRAQHAGRIDTLALSEDQNPVIIEYKNVESSDLINQSLFYLSWIDDHRGDFEIAAQRALGPKTVVDWSDVRVICIAPNYRKYDLHAVRVGMAGPARISPRRRARSGEKKGLAYLARVVTPACVVSFTRRARSRRRSHKGQGPSSVMRNWTPNGRT